MQETVSFSERDNMPLTNISSALLLSKKVKEIEEQYISQNAKNLTSSHKAFTLSSIYTITGFLESSINDLYANAKDNIIEYLKGIETHITKLVEFDENNFNKELDKKIIKNSGSKIIQKYQYALKLLNIPLIDESNSNLSDIILIIHIRHYFIHHSAVWLKCGEDEQTKYFVLKGRFNENPMSKKSINPFFPDKLLGYGFLQWSIDSSIKFVMDFYNKISLEYDFIKKLNNILIENHE